MTTNNDALRDGIDPPSTRRAIEADWVTERLNANVALLKLKRQMTDQEIADAAGWPSRQTLHNRLTGWGTWQADDIARVAAAFRVQVHVMFADEPEVLQWIKANDDYKPPKYKPVPRMRGRNAGDTGKRNQSRAAAAKKKAPAKKAPAKGKKAPAKSAARTKAATA